MSTNNFKISADRSLRRVRNYLPSLGGCWLLFLVIVIVGPAFATIPSLFPQTPFTTSTSLSYFLVMVPAFIWIYVASIVKGNNEAVRFNSPSWGKIHPVVLFILCAVYVFALGVVVEPIASAIPMPEKFKEIFNDMFYGSSVLDTFIAVSIFAPLMEEFICRGVMLRGLLKHTSPTKAIIWSAVIFAVLHLNPWQALPAFALGLFFGWIYYRTRSLWLTIFMHFFNNTTSLVFTRIFPDMDAEASYSSIMSTSAYCVLYGVSAVIAVLVILYLNKKLKNETLSS